MNESTNFVKFSRKLRLVLKANSFSETTSRGNSGSSCFGYLGQFDTFVSPLPKVAKASKATVTVAVCSRKTDSLD
jgi:hypothetical protein